MAKAVSKAAEKEIMAAATKPEAPKPQAPAAPAPRAAKTDPAKPKPSAKPAAKTPGKAMVAYHPRVDGDMPFTVFMGMRFVANVAREVTNPELIAKAVGNPWFSVDGKSSPMRKPGPARDASEDAASLDNKKTEAKEVEVAEVMGEGDGYTD